MAEPMHFDLVSPERLLISEEVESVVVPGSEGEFTVLARHAPFMSTLRPGVIEVRGLGGAARRIFVRGGFADVTPTGLTILADHAAPVDEMSAAAFDEEIRLAEEEMAGAGDHHARRLQAETRLGQLRDARRWILPA
jgi:F-type H+-transporting ATPase subunit epsilon